MRSNKKRKLYNFPLLLQLLYKNLLMNEEICTHIQTYECVHTQHPSIFIIFYRYSKYTRIHITLPVSVYLLMIIIYEI